MEIIHTTSPVPPNGIHTDTGTYTQKKPCQERKQLDVYSTMTMVSEMDPQTDRQREYRQTDRQTDREEGT